MLPLHYNVVVGGVNPTVVRLLTILLEVAAGQQQQYCCYGCSTVVLIGFTCPAITVGTVILRALDRVRERVLGLLCLSITQIPAFYGCSTFYYCVEFYCVAKFKGVRTRKRHSI